MTYLDAWHEKVARSERAVSVFLQEGAWLTGQAGHVRLIENTWPDRYEARWQLVGIPGDMHSVALSPEATRRALDVLRGLPQIASAVSDANLWVFDLRLRGGGTSIEGRAHVARRVLEPMRSFHVWRVLEAHSFDAGALVGIDGARFALAGLARTAGLL